MESPFIADARLITVHEAYTAYLRDASALLPNGYLLELNIDLRDVVPVDKARFKRASRIPPRIQSPANTPFQLAGTRTRTGMGTPKTSRP
jgi:hypothetical protein